MDTSSYSYPISLFYDNLISLQGCYPSLLDWFRQKAGIFIGIACAIALIEVSQQNCCCCCYRCGWRCCRCYYLFAVDRPLVSSKDNNDQDDQIMIDHPRYPFILLNQLLLTSTGVSVWPNWSGSVRGVFHLSLFREHQHLHFCRRWRFLFITEWKINPNITRPLFTYS